MRKSEEEELPEPPKVLGDYRIIKRVGRGGMGEIFLAFDPFFGRKIAIKRMLPHLFKYKSAVKRFLNEVKIASKLQHPSIIAIYSMHETRDDIYYTMPFVEGQTLGSILKETRELEKQGSHAHPIGSSIPGLMHIFLQICQAVEYCHVQGFLHRDIKPENILIGKFGEAILIDWGLACPIGGVLPEDDIDEPVGTSVGLDLSLTQPGKVPGSVAFMAPETALSGEANPVTDIYALGITLYNLLSLRLPFIRGELKDFIKSMSLEKWLDPQDVTPNREIPALLSSITKQCIHPIPSKRFQSVSDLIKAVKNYIEGSPEWTLSKQILMDQKKEWMFEENIALTKHLAIASREPWVDWAHIMISKASFPDIIQVKTGIEPANNSLGIGFLFCVPHTYRIEHLEEGLLLWIGGPKSPVCKIFRSGVEVLSVDAPSLNKEKKHIATIEIRNNHISLDLDDQKVLSYYSHLPLIGGHMGMIRKDMNTAIKALNIYEGSQNVMVNCLAIPDAFFISKDFDRALHEYRKIAQSFQGRFEGREAIFRAGMTLLEKAKHKNELFSSDSLHDAAIDEFNKLHNTPGAPLEYLGKSLTYLLKGQGEEEVKCLEFACRKFAKHPLKKLLKEQSNIRFHQVSKENRKLTSLFALLILDHIPELLENQDTYHLLLQLQNQTSPFPYFSYKEDCSKTLDPLLLSIQLASFLMKPISLFELMNGKTAQLTKNYQALESMLFTLLEMGYPELAKYMLSHFKLEESDYFFNELKTHIQYLLSYKEVGIEKTLELLRGSSPFNENNSSQRKGLFFLMDSCLYLKEAGAHYGLFDGIDLESLKPLKLWHALLCRDLEAADALIKTLDSSLFNLSSSPYYLLYGCYLAMKKGQRAALYHFQISVEVAHPGLYCLLSYYLSGKITLNQAWHEKAFSYEYVALNRQLTLFYTCLNKKRRAHHFEELALKEKKNVQIPLNFLNDSL